MTDKMQFTKIGFEGEGEALKVQLFYNDLSELGGSETHKVGCTDAPKDSFLKAMKKMADHAKFFCDFPEEYIKNLRVLSLNIHWVKGKMKASLQCSILLYNCVEFKFTSPVYAEVLQADDDPTITLPEDVIKAIKTLLGQAKKYASGERSQVPMFKKEPLDKRPVDKGEKPIDGRQAVAPFEDQERGSDGRFGSKKKVG